MANEIRRRFDFCAGGLSAGMLTSDTLMQSAGLADLPALASDEHAMLTLFRTDLAGRVTQKETVKVTAHTGGATTATVTRGQEGTSAQTWITGDRWSMTEIASDDVFVCKSTTRPSNPWIGMVIKEYDTGYMRQWNGSNWVHLANARLLAIGAALVGSPPAVDGAAGAPFYWQAGTVVFTSDASGYATITFPTPFPNGLICPICVAGSGGAGTWWLIVNDGGFSTSAFQVRTLGPSGAVSVLVRAHWMALGW